MSDLVGSGLTWSDLVRLFSQPRRAYPGIVAPTFASSPALKYLAWSHLAAKGTRCHLSFVVPGSKTERNERMTCLARKLLCHIQVCRHVAWTMRADYVLPDVARHGLIWLGLAWKNTKRTITNQYQNITATLLRPPLAAPYVRSGHANPFSDTLRGYHTGSARTHFPPWGRVN